MCVVPTALEHANMGAAASRKVTVNVALSKNSDSRDRAGVFTNL